MPVWRKLYLGGTNDSLEEGKSLPQLVIIDGGKRLKLSAAT
ncbi:MAG: hypothetical protein R2795_13950 [Saprospiraceae bacterium]